MTAPLRSAAFSVRVLPSDRALALSVRPGHSVVVLGYLGEPFLRVDRRGVAVNAASPTAVLPGAAARACGAVAVAAGVAAAVLGCVVYAAALRRERLPSPLWQDLPR
ncbi:MAG TPA: hypothetical protein VFL66_02560 [Gaiellaceae bacterium]|nr:hypothetical protein [Gaiellaceae bacterium]